jgi:hypothetical protein
MPSPARALIVACAVLFPGATLVSMAASGCESQAYIPLPVYEASVPDTTVVAMPDTGLGDTSADVGVVSADASADVSPDVASDAGMDSSDGEATDGRSDAAEDAHDAATDSMKEVDGAADGGTAADAAEEG